MPEIDNYSLILVIGLAMGLLPWCAIHALRGKSRRVENTGIFPFFAQAVSGMTRNWKLATALLILPVPFAAPLYAMNLISAGDLVLNIWSIIIIYAWHRANLPEHIASFRRQTPLYAGFQILVASLFLTMIAVAIGVASYLLMRPDMLMTYLSGTVIPPMPIEISEQSLRLAGFGAILAIASPILARWVLVVPSVALGWSALYGAAWKASRPVFIPLTLALWLAVLAVLPVHYVLDQLVWPSLPYSPSNDVMADVATDMDWPSLFAYWAPATIISNAYILISVGIVSAAYRVTDMPNKGGPLDALREIYE